MFVMILIKMMMMIRMRKRIRMKVMIFLLLWFYPSAPHSQIIMIMILKLVDAPAIMM